VAEHQSTDIAICDLKVLANQLWFHEPILVEEDRPAGPDDFHRGAFDSPGFPQAPLRYLVVADFLLGFQFRDPGLKLSELPFLGLDIGRNTLFRKVRL
jgi:hypothetical protein